MQILTRSSFRIAPVILCSAITLAASVNAGAESNSLAKSVADVSIEGHNFVLAARYGHRHVIINQLNDGLDIELIDELGNTALIAAAAANQRSILKLLLQRGANVNAQSGDGTSALMNAAVYGNLEIAKALIEVGAEIDLKKSNGETALVGAIQYGHLPMVELLLSKGADANVVKLGTFKNGAGFTPLMYVAQHGFKGAMGDWSALTSILLKYGAKTELMRANGDSALTIAKWHGHDEIVALLSRAGARDETYYTTLSNDEALVKAAMIGDLAKIKVLVAQSANVNYRDKNSGVTPLATAVYYGNLDIVRTLVGNGADVNHRPWGLKEQRIASSSVTFKERELLRTIARGDTALIIAAQKNSIEIASYLIEKGARISVANRKKETPSLIVVRNGNAAFMTLLLDNGVDPDRARIERKIDPFITRSHKKEPRPSLLIEAAAGGHTGTVRVLLNAGAQVDIQDDIGRSALFKASEQGHSSTVALLLAHQADPNLYDNSGRTSLMVASKNGYKNIVEALIAHNADVNAIEQRGSNSHRDISVGGMTALIYSSRGGHVDIAEILLQNGANKRLSSNTGETALAAAKQYGFKEIEQLLAGGGSVDE